MTYFGLIVEPDIPLEPCVDLHRTIASFSHSDCWNFFETRKEDLPRLLACLIIPEEVILENRSLNGTMEQQRIYSATCHDTIN